MDNEEKNLGGRPPIYEATQENFDKVDKLCEDYFDYIKGEYKEIQLKEDETEEDQRYVTIRQGEFPTVTGLTLYLGFESKDTLYSYGKKDGFSYSIKKALTKIEQFHEFRVAQGDKCIGNIFVLKNFNWKDTQTLAGDRENPLSIIEIGYENKKE